MVRPDPWLGIAGVLAVLTALFGTLKVLEQLIRPHPELLRKLLHVGMGLVVVAFPWVFVDRWPVLILATISAAVLLVVKYRPQISVNVGSVLTGVGRPSLGEICFPAAVAALALLTWREPLLYVVPLLILALADAVAALVGIVYGRVRYVTSDGLKSAEGSIAFFAIAFLSVHVPLLLFTDVGRPQTLLIATIIGLLSMLIEAVSARGLDNLLIPLGAYAFLRLYLHASVDSLVFRLMVTLGLLTFALAWRRRTSLSDSGLIAAVLFGYGAWMLGGWSWVIGPVILFLAHVGLWPRTTKLPTDHLLTVIAIVGPGLLWLAIQVAVPQRVSWFVAYATTFGCHLMFMGVSRIDLGQSIGRRLAKLTAAMVAGWLLTLLQIAVSPNSATTWHARQILLATGLSTAIAGITFFSSIPTLYRSASPVHIVHWVGFSIAIIASVLAFLIVSV